MKKLCLVASLLLITMLCGCFPMEGEGSEAPAATIAPLTAPIFTEIEPLVSMYEMVEIDAKLDELEALLGQYETHSTENGESYYQWVKDGVGVAVSVRPDETVFGKVLYFEDLRQLQVLAGPVELSNAMLVETNSELMYAQLLMGSDGVEIAHIMSSDAAGFEKEMRLYRWVNSDGSHLDIEVGNDDKVLSCKAYLVSGV